MSSGKPSSAKEGDWLCEDAECNNVNFERRTSCNLCGKEKPSASGDKTKLVGHEIGTTAAEKSKGLFSADDWQCGRCANVNWARRSTCNMCNAPKFSDNEERTGLGGGYNDRGTVEYKAREDSASSDEFDDFGRRKKKLSKSSNRSDLEPTSSTLDDEEDDDDEGDVDLSKYKLDSESEGEGEDNANLTKYDLTETRVRKEDNSRSVRRSRSRSPRTSMHSAKSRKDSLPSSQSRKRSRSRDRSRRSRSRSRSRHGRYDRSEKSRSRRSPSPSHRKSKSYHRSDR